MKEQLPAPDFDSNRYERVTQKWICGRAADGQACRLGPDGRGNCRAGFECTPALDLKEGESAGRYRCTRPKEYGGPCEHEPMPDGTCSRLIPKCAPVRSARAKRGLFTWIVVTASIATLLIVLAGPTRWKLINPGPVADPHSGAAFARLSASGKNEGSGCGACHATARTNMGAWLAAAFSADPGPVHWRKLARRDPPEMNAIDQSCQSCHPAHAFHEPNVVRDHSCSACHQEHKGTLALHRPEDRNCISCHGDAAVMDASYEKGQRLAPSAFVFRPSLGRLLFQAPRPERGYTQVFRSFADHPEFQVIREHLRETNSLKFNHQRHFAADIPSWNGKKLECASCHRSDASGQFHLKISYETNCKSCHSLQFDPTNPKLLVPHGNAEAVHAFLRSLPTQYADYGRREKGIRSQRDLETFVRVQLGQLREQMLSVDELEQKIFFTAKRWAPGGRVGNLPDEGKPLFYGCAYCHEVKSNTNGAAIVTFPAIPDRWLVRGSFNHGKHTAINCDRCHNATKSQETAEILLPSKSTCAECHSPSGGVAHSCSICHSYHTPTKPTQVAVSAADNNH